MNTRTFTSDEHTMKFIILLAFGVATVLAEEPSQALKDFSVGHTQFTADVYKELLKSNSGNFLVCPLSVDTVLALVHAGAKGQTAQQLSSGLHLPENSEKIQKIFTELTSNLKGNDFYNLSSANKVYVKDGFKISDSFKSTAVNVFDADIQNIDFSKSEKAASEINKWVEDKTHDKIKDLIKSDDLSSSTVAILINAIFFQGYWETKFYKDQTEKKPFHLNSKNQAEVDMMQIKDLYNYYESSELNAKFLELYYKRHEVSMTIVLPNEVEGLGALESQIANVITSPKYKPYEVKVQLPKFKIETTIQFKPILQALGIKDAFESYADFSGIGANKDNLQISKVVQKAFIEVDEEGTTAAAATYLDMVFTSALVTREPPKEFTADHPFIFYLKHGSTILFVGRYVGTK